MYTEDPKLIANVAALAGTIMLEAHAESYRVEDTVRRILETSGFETTEVVSTTTGLFFSLDDKRTNAEPITVVRRIDERGNQLNKIYRVNNISRQLTGGEISFQEAYNKLEIVDESEYPPQMKDIATALLVVGFAILLGGNWMEVFISVFAGLAVAGTRLFKEFINLNDFIHGLLTTLITTFFISLVVYFLPYKDVSRHILIISAFMPLYPGTAVTNGLRDTLKGDYVSGIARVADAVVIAMSLALGMAAGLSLFGGVMSWL